MKAANDDETRAENDLARLTCIPERYTLAATAEGSAGKADDLMIQNFLNTLAKVAIASRNLQSEKEGE